MQPISGAFLLAACGLAAACLTAAVVLWPRAAGTGPRSLLARCGMLLAVQVTLTAAVVLVVNRHFVFYATWNDVLGRDGAQARIDHVQPDRGDAGLVRRTTTDLGPRRRGHPRDPLKDGRIDRLEIRGARSGLDAEAYVYLPARYFQPAYAARRLPVVILISGGPSDTGTAWLRQARLPEAADAAARGPGGAQPMVYVMVRSARGLVPAADGPRPTACLNLPGRPDGQAETYFAQDLPLALTSLYRLPRTRQGWGVAGYASGGQCAVRLAMLHSDRFAAAAGLDGRFGTPTDAPETAPPPAGTPAAAPVAPPAAPPRPDDPYGGSDAYRLDNDLLWRMEHLPPPPVAVLAAAGDGGAGARDADRFAALARPPMSAAKTLVPGAPGTLAEWRAHLPPVLEWLSARLRGE